MDAKSEATSNPEAEEDILDEAKKNAQLWYAKDKTKTIQEEILNIL